MSNYQKHVIIGRLSADPIIRNTRSGLSVTNFDVPVNEKTSRGETVTWFRVVAWDRLAETCARYLRKGSTVMVEGRRLKASGWQDRSGKIRTTLELTASQVLFLDGTASSSPDGAPPASARHQGARPAASHSRPQQPAFDNSSSAQDDYAYFDQDMPF